MDKKEVWKATDVDLPPDKLEEARHILLNSYHSFVQNHAGYIIAIMLGFFALM